MSLTNTVEKAFEQYAGCTIIDRAICDARDMLKPSARMSMYAQYIEKITADKPYKKSQKSVAAAMDHFYVHGDMSLYPMLARLGKPFAMRYVLEDFQGNTGTIEEPNNEAASRYTEMRLAKLSGHLFEDIEKDTIKKWFDSYTGEEQYPSVLPSKGFYNIVNGTSGIATGISSSIPQFNLKEVNEALIKLIENPNISDDELICMPDFAGGGLLLNAAEVRESLKKGTGLSCKLRAKVEYDKKNNRLIITETPYGVYTATILGQLKDIAESEENPGIERPLDFSTIKANIEIELNKRANVDKIIKYLYKNTSIQYHYPINMIMLDNGKTPKLFTWREALQAHLAHEKQVYLRGYAYDLEKIKARLHIIIGLLKAIDMIDEVIATIKAASDSKTANIALQKLLEIDSEQAKAILDIKLSRLAHLEITKLTTERDTLIKEKERIEAIIADEKKLDAEIIKGLRAVADRYGDARRTTISNIEGDAEDTPVDVKQIQISATNMGNIYAVETSSLYTQKRGSVGAKFKLGDGEYVVNTITASTTDKILFFTELGQVAHCAAANIVLNEMSSIYTLVKFGDNDKICAMAALRKDAAPYIIFTTQRGIIKKSALTEYNLTRATPVAAIKLDEGDKIVSINFVGTQKIGVLSAKGHFIITPSANIKAIGRVARGVIGMKLEDGDEVISAKIIPEDTKEIVSITGNGLIKRTAIAEYTTTDRGVKGQLIQKLNDGDWSADFLPLAAEASVLVSTTHAGLKINYTDIPTHGRATLGVKSINLAPKSNVIAISQV